MGSFNISVYVKNDDLAVYADNVEVLNQKAREAFEKELCRIKESVAKLNFVPFIPSVLEDVSEDAVHVRMANNRVRKASEKLYGVSMRKEKGKKEAEK
jgi:hypothetical protein